MGFNNTAIGAFAMPNNTTDSLNTAIGVQALNANSRFSQSTVNALIRARLCCNCAN